VRLGTGAPRAAAVPRNENRPARAGPDGAVTGA
jgi:hypothetical protein